MTMDDVLFSCLVTVSGITNTQTAILERFGPKMHCAMQSRQMELHYLRKLSESIIPFILPPNSLQCRYVMSSNNIALTLTTSRLSLFSLKVPFEHGGKANV